MDISRLHGQYWFAGGAVKSFHLDIQNSRIEIVLFVKRIKRDRASGSLQENDLEPCTLQLTFERLIEVSLFNKFPTQGYLLNSTTFDNTGNGMEVSFHVYDSSNYVYEKDNWVIKAKRITWKEV
jgi:hypothetical protein